MVDLIKLAYNYEELEPSIDKETMEIHHSKHHNAYVTKFNEAVAGTIWDSETIEEVISNLDTVSEDIRGAVRNNGGGVINHNLFFTQLTPGGKELADGKFKTAIDATFGSVESLIEELKKAGATRFGSGWSWLVLTDGKLKVMSTANQDSPLTEGHTPLLGIDVWEHAYYLKYQNKRPDYLTAIFDVIDWTVVEERYNSVN